MIVRSGLIRKKPDWTQDDFRRYWREHHGALAAKLPGLRRYEQNHVVDSVQRGISYPRGLEQLDGFSMLWFDSEAAMRAAIATEAGRALVADENHFIGDLRRVERSQVSCRSVQPGPASCRSHRSSSIEIRSTGLCPGRR